MTQTIEITPTGDAPADTGAIDDQIPGVEVTWPAASRAESTMEPPESTMEDTLAATERAVEQALKSATATVGLLKRALTAARNGHVRDLRKALAGAEGSAGALTAQTGDLRTGFDFDEQAYLASGDYVRELLAAAEAAGVSMHQQDDLLLCYPSLVRVISAEAAVQIDTAKERRLRPSVLIAQLARNQDRAPRFRAEGFLDALRTAYELLIVRDGKKPDGVVRLVDVWQVLTLLPQGGKYSKQEFARDLYLLDQSGVTSTGRSPRQLRWSASTGTKGAGILVTVSRTGQQQLYWGISFTRAEPGAAA